MSPAPGTAATRLDCRLLCADASAYGISPGPTFKPDEPYYSLAGFIGQPVVIDQGAAGIDAALVGLTPDGILVAFRGTLPPEQLNLAVILDWLQDFACKPVESPLFPGAVHGGFLDALMRLWPDVNAAVRALQIKNPTAPLRVTGHSKGGALATLAAWCFQKEGITPAEVVTFASPRAGDATFAAAYEQLGIVQRRYENYLDAVPFYPPDFNTLDRLRHLPGASAHASAAEDWSYTPVGPLRYIQKDGSVTGDSSALKKQRIEEIWMALLEGHASRVGDAHSLTPAGSMAYCRGVCGDLQYLSIASEQSIGLNDSKT